MGHIGTKNPQLLTGGCLQPFWLVAGVRLDIVKLGGAAIIAWATNRAGLLWGHEIPALDATEPLRTVLIDDRAVAWLVTAAGVILATHRCLGLGFSWLSHPVQFPGTQSRTEWLASPSRWCQGFRCLQTAGFQRLAETEPNWRNGTLSWQGPFRFCFAEVLLCTWRYQVKQLNPINQLVLLFNFYCLGLIPVFLMNSFFSGGVFFFIYYY